MLGAIIGDICGSVYEFHRTKNYDHVELFKEGCYPTDDSIMTVAIAKAMIDSENMEIVDVVETAKRSMLYYGFLFPKAGYGGRFHRWLKGDPKVSNDSYGNGSAMRVSAVGWMYDTIEETQSHAWASAAPSHNHPEGVKGAQAIASAIFYARNGKSKDEIRELIERDFYKLNFTLDDIRAEYRFDETCPGSCPQAIEAFLESTDYVDAIKKAIALGGDADTIAAMTGGIAEAFYGVPTEIATAAFGILVNQHDPVHVYNNEILADEIKRFWKYLEDRNMKSPRPSGF